MYRTTLKPSIFDLSTQDYRDRVLLSEKEGSLRGLEAVIYPSKFQ